MSGANVFFSFVWLHLGSQSFILSSVAADGWVVMYDTSLEVSYYLTSGSFYYLSTIISDQNKSLHGHVRRVIGNISI